MMMLQRAQLSGVEVFDQIEVVDGNYVDYVGDFCSLNVDDSIKVIIKTDMFFRIQV